jgi:N-acetylglucosamine kinase-like BadF-type ATPase
VIDGGQSAIRARSTEADDVVEVDGVSRDASSGDSVVKAIASAWRSLGSPAIDRAVLGLTTAPVDPVPADSLAFRVSRATGAVEVWVCDDAVTNHAGALSCGWGVSLTAGTGVACLVVPERGDPRIIGGHGYLLGDEGGGFWIGREGLRAALRAAEARASPTILRDLAAERFGELDRVPVRLHDEARSVDVIARFASDVLAAAGDDAVAASIVDAAAEELSSLVRAAVDVAEPAAGNGTVPVALGGRLLATPTPLRVALDARLPSDRRIEARTADASPLVGAMSMGTQPRPGRYASLVHIWRGDAA